jgi:hypothetical protein
VKETPDRTVINQLEVIARPLLTKLLSIPEKLWQCEAGGEEFTQAFADACEILMSFTHHFEHEEKVEFSSWLWGIVPPLIEIANDWGRHMTEHFCRICDIVVNFCSARDQLFRPISSITDAAATPPRTNGRNRLQPLEGGKEASYGTQVVEFCCNVRSLSLA